MEVYFALHISFTILSSEIWNLARVGICSCEEDVSFRYWLSIAAMRFTRKHRGTANRSFKRASVVRRVFRDNENSSLRYFTMHVCCRRWSLRVHLSWWLSSLFFHVAWSAFSHDHILTWSYRGAKARRCCQQPLLLQWNAVRWHIRIDASLSVLKFVKMINMFECDLPEDLSTFTNFNPSWLPELRF